jgi:hypothetical protein
MIENDTLRAGVAAGILSEAQAARLAALGQSRAGARENLKPEDEPFELFRGFNEIFIVVGLVILGMGWSGVVAAVLAGEIAQIPRLFGGAAALTAVFLWLLSEYFVRRRRMVAPAITLTVFWAWNAVFGLTAGLAEPVMIAQGDWSSMKLPLGLGTVAMLVYWWRFRVPIALSAAVLGIFAALVTASVERGETPDSLRDLFLLSGEGVVAWITLLLGLAVFALAMAFDMSDPHRVTRRSANGFWLHILAAPAIVNTVALTLLTEGGRGWLLILFLAVIALVAIVIDRRSFLIAGVGYAVAMASSLSDIAGVSWTILALGVALLLTGAFWERIRGWLLARLGAVLPLRRLPPG